ncbi:hypothetical protein KC345_g285 [Hortaea werneckii]|nr:hypothetical protein KC345_g285 [Hortaea werneckii]
MYATIASDDTGSYGILLFASFSKAGTIPSGLHTSHKAYQIPEILDHISSLLTRRPTVLVYAWSRAHGGSSTRTSSVSTSHHSSGSCHAYGAIVLPRKAQSTIKALMTDIRPPVSKSGSTLLQYLNGIAQRLLSVFSRARRKQQHGAMSIYCSDTCSRFSVSLITTGRCSGPERNIRILGRCCFVLTGRRYDKLTESLYTVVLLRKPSKAPFGGLSRPISLTRWPIMAPAVHPSTPLGRLKRRSFVPGFEAFFIGGTPCSLRKPVYGRRRKMERMTGMAYKICGWDDEEWISSISSLRPEMFSTTYF